MDKYRDRAIQEELYEFWHGGSGVEVMLEQSETNSRTNERMSALLSIMAYTETCWRGKYKDLYRGMVDIIQRHYLNLDAFARGQAIEMVKASAMNQPEFEEQKKSKRGILGLFK